MSEKDNTNKQTSRIDKFLVFSKFVLLVFIAVSFVLFYSCSYRNFPVSTAQHHFAKYDEDKSTDVIFPKANVLIVMDYSSKFQNDEYSDFKQLSKLLNTLPHIDYDLVLIKGSDEISTILNNIDNSLLLRVYHKKEYQYILSFGDKAITPAKEIQGLFYPQAQMLLYGVSTDAANNILLPVKSVEDNILNTILTAKTLDPYTNKLIFLCRSGDYCDVIINIVENQKSNFGNIPYTVLKTDEYGIDQAIEYINEKGKNSSVFYVSFMPDESVDVFHDHIIAQIQNQVSNPIFNLSPMTQENNIQNSIRYWPLEQQNSGTAYIGIKPKNITIYGCELVEFAALNILAQEKNKASAKQYADTSNFISEYMETIDINDFPSTANEQFVFCQTNSMLTVKENLQPGDLIFTSSKSNGTPSDIDGVSIYVNEEVVIRINSLGIICFMKPLTKEHIVAYARPYSYLDEKPPKPNQ